MPNPPVINDELAQIEQDLGLFHKKYQMDDRTFLNRFTKGELGDDVDFQVWESVLVLRDELLEKMKGAFKPI